MPRKKKAEASVAEPEIPQIRDRITELRRVKASDLTAHPQNWREHNGFQRKAFDGLLDEIGFAGAILTFTDDDGKLIIIDGHLRAEQTGDAEIPVLITDLTNDEAKMVLATYDPLGALALSDAAMLTSLLEGITAEDEAITALLEDIDDQYGVSGTTPENPADEWEGMPEFEQDDLSAWKSITVNFESKEAMDMFGKVVMQPLTSKTRFIWYPQQANVKASDKRYEESDANPEAE